LAIPIFKYLQRCIPKSQTLFSFLQTEEHQSVGKSQALPDFSGWNNKIASVSGDCFATQTTDGEVIPVP
jgi:hypothetical protein